MSALPDLKPGETEFLEFWNALRGDRPMPSRRDFVAEDLGPLLGWIHLLVCLDRGTDFRYSVFSARTPAYTIREMTGQRVSAWESPRREDALGYYSFVYRAAAPCYMASIEAFDEETVAISRLSVPFGEDGIVDHIATLLTYHNRDAMTVLPICALPTD